MADALAQLHMEQAGYLGETRAAFKMMVDNFDQLLVEYQRVAPLGAVNTHPVRMVKNSRDRLLKIVEAQEA